MAACAATIYDDLPGGVRVLEVTPSLVSELQEERLNPPQITQEMAEQIGPKMPEPAGYVMGPGDRIHVTIDIVSKEGLLQRMYPSTEDTMQDVPMKTIAGDGTIPLPYIEPVKVGGKTQSEAEAAITKAYVDAEIYKSPMVEVEVAEYRSRRVTITGEVKEPGEYFVTDKNHTVVSALAIAKGATQNANLSEVKLRRANGKDLSLDVYAMLNEGQMAQNVTLENGDVLFVPNLRSGRVYVLGEVDHPRMQAMANGSMNALEAITEAGGWNKVFADRGNVYVVRGYPFGSAARKLREGEYPNYSSPADDVANIDVFHIDMAQTAKLALADQFPLKPRDIVYVSTKPLGEWNRFINLLLPSSIESLTNTGTRVQDESAR